ncbi:hypothetical protein HDU97_003943 [Phlyctochytrium planicorne]|nr:hypothetical protein HDU97_003943 [Phlyctochytrium planicorne]
MIEPHADYINLELTVAAISAAYLFIAGSIYFARYLRWSRIAAAGFVPVSTSIEGEAADASIESTDADENAEDALKKVEDLRSRAKSVSNLGWTIFAFGAVLLHLSVWNVVLDARDIKNSGDISWALVKPLVADLFWALALGYLTLLQFLDVYSAAPPSAFPIVAAQISPIFTSHAVFFSLLMVSSAAETYLLSEYILKDPPTHWDPVQMDHFKKSLWIHAAEAGLAMIAIFVGLSRNGLIKSLIPRVELYKYKDEETHETKANLWEILSFGWMNPLLDLGADRPLTEDDLWRLRDRDTTHTSVRRYNKHKKHHKALYMSILATVWKEFIPQQICGFFSAVLQLALPFFLYMILSLLEDPNASDKSRKSGLYLIILFTCMMAKAVIDGQMYFLGRKVSMQVRSILVNEIYEKSLRRATGVSPPATSTASTEESKDKAEKSEGEDVEKAEEKDEKKDEQKEKKEEEKEPEKEDASIGKIVTLMSVDAERIREFMSYSHRSFCQNIVSTVLSVTGLIYVLGWPALAGLTIVLISGPASGFVGSWLNKVQDEMMASTDKRVNIVNEMLSGIRIIKYFAWERFFEKKIQEARKTELWNIVRLAVVYLAFGLVGYGSSLFVNVATFAFYTLVAGHRLTPETAFTGVVLLNIVAELMGVLPYEIMSILQARVSYERINTFLGEQELDRFASADESAESLTSTAPIGFVKARFSYFSSVPKNGDAAETAAAAPVEGTDTESLGGDTIASSGKSSSSSATNGFSLKDVDVQFKIGGLNVVCGATGSGKTSICLALLGELKRLGGGAYLNDPALPGPFTSTSVGEPTGVAYVAQTSWLLNATIRDNITMGAEFNLERYKAVLEACALIRDLETLDGGDLTEIGEKGVNVSGGQKQRISLARAVYSNASVLILDDPLSAVDAPTARHLVANAILGPLTKGRTVILVSHAVSLVLPVADYVIVMNGGEVIAQGSAADVAANPAVADITERTVSSSQLDLTIGEEAGAKGKGKGKDKDESKGTAIADASKATKIVEKEEKAAGDVKWSIYVYYLRFAGGFPYIFAIFATLCVIYIISFLSDNWIRQWSDKKPDVNGTEFAAMVNTFTPLAVSSGASLLTSNAAGYGTGWSAVYKATIMSNPLTAVLFGWESNPMKVSTATTEPLNQSDRSYVFYYAMFAIAIMFMHDVFNVVFEIGSILASYRIHNMLLKSVLGAPLRFFEVTPLGRILNRFSKDISAVDGEVMRCISWFLDRNMSAIFILLIIAYGAPSFILVIPGIVYTFRHFAVRYLKTSRELKRLESVSRSPLYSQFSETLNGVATIRAYGQSERFKNQSQVKLDENHRAYYLLWASNRWLTIRTDMISASVVFFAGAAILLGGEGVNPSWAGLILRYASQFAESILWVIRSHAEMEMAMNSVERCQEYSVIEQEPPAIVDDYRPPANSDIVQWPDQGQVDVSSLSIRYSANLPLVLKNLSFSTLKGEKIGVVGRTGAGKSTLSLAFFRIIPFAGGNITIDGYDIGKMGLQDLRERLTIIPQDPVLFTGTIRSNLDPLGKHTDAELWKVLRSTHVLDSMQSSGSSSNLLALAETAETVPGSVDGSSTAETQTAGGNSEFSLDTAVAENGTNFSQGQRQLICMARALLRRSKVIFLDEATASIDSATDARIQTTIREELKDATIFCIAHRLRTIVDYDRVLVLDHGEVIEYGSPIDLIERSPVGHFKHMCEDSGEYDELVQIARDAAVAAAKRRAGEPVPYSL